MQVIVYTAVLFCSLSSALPNDGSSRISNGIVATQQQFPFMASIQQISQATLASRGHICGGVLVTRQQVITAASCVTTIQANGSFTLNNANLYRVFAGSVSLTGDTVDRIRTIERITVHPEFIKAPSHVNDIAVLNLTTEFAATVVTPASLPATSFLPATNTQCTVAGWGRTTVNGAVSGQLLFGNKYIFDQDTCRNVYTTKTQTPNVLPTMVCAAFFDVLSSTCLTDDGGPLICNGTLTGILAYNGDCAMSSVPEIYTRVSNYTTWIRPLLSSSHKVNSGKPFIALILISQMVFAAIIS